MNVGNGNFLVGAVAGDVIGSVYEHYRTKRMDFQLFPAGSRFTDDTVMTVANADWLLNGGDLARIMQRYGNRYPNAGYGGMFRKWLREDPPQPYHSFGNGSAMRVSPVGWAFDMLKETLRYVERNINCRKAKRGSHPQSSRRDKRGASCSCLHLSCPATQNETRDKGIRRTDVRI